MKTGAHLKIQSMGDNVLGVRLKGNPEQPEPIHFRVVLPFGDVDIVRCNDASYWVHCRVDKPSDNGDPYRKFGKFIDARIDVIGKHASDCDSGDFGNPDAYHVAVKMDKA